MHQTERVFLSLVGEVKRDKSELRWSIIFATGQHSFKISLKLSFFTAQVIKLPLTRGVTLCIVVTASICLDAGSKRHSNRSICVLNSSPIQQRSVPEGKKNNSSFSRQCVVWVFRYASEAPASAGSRARENKNVYNLFVDLLLSSSSYCLLSLSLSVAIRPLHKAWVSKLFWSCLLCANWDHKSHSFLLRANLQTI